MTTIETARDRHGNNLAAAISWLRSTMDADALAHAHTRQFRDNFIEFMKENYSQNFSFVGK